MKIGIVIGSVRENSESARIGEFVNSRIKNLYPNFDVELFNLRDLNLPIWDESIYGKDSESFTAWQPICERLSTCDGFVVVTPEWAGMVTPHLKNFFLLCSAGELAHKPAQIVSISSGMGGAYPVAELRMSSYKNTMIIWLPDHIVLRFVTDLFTSEEPTDLDKELSERIDYSAKMLVESAVALAPVRASVQNLQQYGYGM